MLPIICSALKQIFNLLRMNRQRWRTELWKRKYNWRKCTHRKNFTLNNLTKIFNATERTCDWRKVMIQIKKKSLWNKLAIRKWYSVITLCMKKIKEKKNWYKKTLATFLIRKYFLFIFYKYKVIKVFPLFLHFTQLIISQ